jgi:hypothetical protein
MILMSFYALLRLKDSQVISDTSHLNWTKPNKALHLTAIPLRFIAAGELGRYIS